ncbi:MAG: 30S ribosomal protein S17 [Chlamydiales bacterium]|nr:30S ribosomal protein S17 [Chlamydiales bacterium]MCH9635777.1 30S ribosomal protein S17 [Chlamydiales bacterium]MCH9704311.1 30S ribosomal protein S17 [Chlamydiota bacterium]
MKQRGSRRTKKGTVVSCKMDKTAIVSVEQSFRHPLYKKVLMRKKKYYAHDENAQELQVGQEVTIVESRPMSKLKRWRVVRGES